MAKVDGIIEKLRAEIPQFIAIDFVDTATGSSVGQGVSIDPKVDATMASNNYAELIQANAGALDFLAIGSDTLEDILITARDAYIIVRPVGAGHFITLILTRRANLSLARQVLGKYEPELLAAASGG